jgi:hypothetical protein
VPCALIYVTYYYGPDAPVTGYLRFFMPTFPALALCAIWVLRQLRISADDVSEGRIAWPVMLGLLVAIAGACNLAAGLGQLERFQRVWMSTQRAGIEARGAGIVPPAIPPGSAVFATDHLAAHLQFVGDDWSVFNLDLFALAYFDRWLAPGPDDPQQADPQRVRNLHDKVKNLSPTDFNRELRRSVVTLLDGDKRVFLVIPRSDAPAMRQRLNESASAIETLDLTPRATWNDASGPEVADATRVNRRQRPKVVASDPALMWQILEVTRPAAPRSAAATSTASSRS